jgi:virginiamycin B lyase
MNAKQQMSIRRLRRAPALAALAVAAACWVAPQADAHVYFASYNGGSISRADLDGSNLLPRITPASSPNAVAVDGQHMYWTSAGTYAIGRANLDGTNPVPNFISGASNPFAIAVDAQHIYWTNPGTASIGRADLDGTNADPTFIKNAELPAVSRSTASTSTGAARPTRTRSGVRGSTAMP